MKYQEITFTDADIVNPADFIPAGDYNPNTIKPHLIHDHGFVLAIVFAEMSQEPCDIESLGIIEMPNPAFSFTALFGAMLANSTISTPRSINQNRS